MKFQKAKGTRDFYPEDLEARKQVFNRLKTVAEKYGFKEVESPAFESLSLLVAKSGPEIKEQVFNLAQKGDESLALRPELTPAITRMFIAKQKELSKPVKWYYLTRMWRYEAPQKGRLREFYQFGVEIFGSDKPEADAECIALAIDSLLALGLTKNDFKIKLNNRKLLQGLIESCNIDEKTIPEVIRLIDKSRKITDKELIEELARLKLSLEQVKDIRKIIGTKDITGLLGLNETAAAGLKEIKAVMNILKDYGKDKFVEIDLSTARGLAYYTGTVFEAFDKDEKIRSLLGGGRYDDLVKQLDGEDCPATGFALGDATTELILKEKKLWPESGSGVDYYIAPINEKVMKDAINLADALRKENSVEIDLMQRNLSRQLDYANAINAKKVVIIGEKDLKDKKVTVKDMKTGEEEKINIDDLR